jgi:methyl-accepting chemotaxis protein
MLKNMKLGAKIASGFGIVILIAAILGVTGWSGVNNVRSFMAEYALWGDIDMVMNEGVTQNILKLDNAMTAYTYNPNEATLKALRDSLEGADNGLEKWYAIVKEYPELEQVAANAKKHLSMTRTVMGEYSESLNRTVQINREWDNLIRQCLIHLERTMEEVIDPAKETAEQSKDIAEMVKWAAIDMVMNESVIANVLKLQTAAHDYVADSTEEGWSKFLATQKAANDGLGEWRAVLGGEQKMEQAAGKIDEYLSPYARLGDEYHEEVAKMLGLKQRADNSLKTLLVTLDDTMETVIDPAKEEKVNAASSAQKRSASVSISVTIGGIIIGILLAFFTIRGITKPINRIIETLNEGSDQVASASTQVSTASQSLAEGSAEQAASLEETSSSLEEMASMTKQNADNANQADNLMKEANQTVGKADQSMRELTTSMEEISRASEETSKIIKTIDEIAFQTNLLALNAAVEAARAGEAGAGFAVVADEVRNLAMRAAEAAKNTAGLIEGTVKKVKDGGELVTRTNEAFGEVAKSASKVGELVGEIAAASNEQSDGIEQVNKAMAEMDKVTQQVAANAEESASASEEMNAQAEQMRWSVEDLVALIGSSGSKVNGGRHRASSRQQGTLGTKVATGVRKVLTAPAKNAEEVAVPKAKPEVRRGAEVKPDKVIPMEEAEFNDF